MRRARGLGRRAVERASVQRPPCRTPCLRRARPPTSPPAAAQYFMCHYSRASTTTYLSRQRKNKLFYQEKRKPQPKHTEEMPASAECKRTSEVIPHSRRVKTILACLARNEDIVGPCPRRLVRTRRSPGSASVT